MVEVPPEPVLRRLFLLVLVESWMAALYLQVSGKCGSMSTSQSCSSEQLPVPVRVPSLCTEDMGIRWAGEEWPANLASAGSLPRSSDFPPLQSRYTWTELPVKPPHNTSTPTGPQRPGQAGSPKGRRWGVRGSPGLSSEQQAKPRLRNQGETPRTLPPTKAAPTKWKEGLSNSQ